MKSHARSERLFSSRCVCVGKDVSLENARSPSSETNYSKRTLEQQSEEVVYKRYVRSHARTFSRSRSSDAPEKKEWSPSSFQKLQFRVFEPLRDLRSKVTSDYRKTTSTLPRPPAFTERERLNPSLVASHHEYHRVLFLNKNTV